MFAFEPEQLRLLTVKCNDYQRCAVWSSFLYLLLVIHAFMHNVHLFSIQEMTYETVWTLSATKQEGEGCGLPETLLIHHSLLPKWHRLPSHCCPNTPAVAVFELWSVLCVYVCVCWLLAQSHWLTLGFTVKSKLFISVCVIVVCFYI